MNRAFVKRARAPARFGAIDSINRRRSAAGMRGVSDIRPALAPVTVLLLFASRRRWHLFVAAIIPERLERPADNSLLVIVTSSDLLAEDNHRGLF